MDQWERLRELDADATKLHERHEDWVASAERTIAELASRGIVVERVLVDVEEIADWCTQHPRPFDGSARAQFVTELLQNRDSRR